jgi:hypothetical protein
MSGQFRLPLGAPKNKGGRPKNRLIPKLMDKDGVSRATVYRRLKAKHEAQLAKAAKTGIGRDHINAHPEGFHPTPPRAVRALLTVEAFVGVIWECACGDGAISRVLEAAGHQVISTDLVDRGYGCGGGPSSPTTPRAPITSSPIRTSNCPGSLSSMRSPASRRAARCACCCRSAGRRRNRGGI